MNTNSNYFMSFKKNYNNTNIISYSHTSYYKKTIRALGSANYVSDSLTTIFRFRKKKLLKNRLLLIKSIFNRRLLSLITSRTLSYSSVLNKNLKLRRPVLRIRGPIITTPLRYLYSNLGSSRYFFLKRNFMNFKMTKNSLKKYLRNKPFSKKNRYSNLGYIIDTSLNKLRSTRISSKPTIKLKNNYNGLIFRNSPLYINYKFSMSAEKLINFKTLVKKTIFSFLKPNQIRRSLMLRRQKITYFRFFNRFNKKDMSSKFLLSNYSLMYKNKTVIIPYGGYTSLPKSIFYSYNKPFYSSFTNNLFLQKFPNYEEFKGEVRVPRVRFKPGYQRL